MTLKSKVAGVSSLQAGNKTYHATMKKFTAQFSLFAAWVWDCQEAALLVHWSRPPQPVRLQAVLISMHAYTLGISSHPAVAFSLLLCASQSHAH